MLHEEKMARLANKKLKYEMASREATAQRTAQLEVLHLQIQLETVKAQAVAPPLSKHSRRASWDSPMAARSEGNHANQSMGEQHVLSWEGLGTEGSDNRVESTPVPGALNFAFHGDVSEGGNYNFQSGNNPSIGSFDANNYF